MPYVVVIALATLTCVLGYNLPYFKAQDFYSVLLVLVAGIYVGLASTDGRRGFLVLEMIVALGVCLLVFLGMWWRDVILLYAFFLQAAWQLLHLPLKRVFRTRPVYSILGALYDGIVGCFVYFHLFH